MRPSEKDCCTKSGLAAATNTGRLLVASVGGTAGCRTCTMDVRAVGAISTPGLSRAYATSDGTTTAKLKTKPLNNSAEPPVCCFATWSSTQTSRIYRVPRLIAPSYIRFDEPWRGHIGTL